MAGYVEECGTCRANRGEIEAPGGVIYEDGYWRLEHILEPIPLAGWLVLKPLRHVESFSDLTAPEAASFGPLVRAATQSMQVVLHPAKIYVAQFSEADGFAHIHFHLIPRSLEAPREARGPRVFDLLREANQEARNLQAIEETAAVVGAIRDLMAKAVQDAG